MSNEDERQLTDVRQVIDLTGDYVLKQLVRFCNEGMITGLSITVNVAGTIYSGLLLGRDEWFNRLTTMAAEADSGAGALIGSFRDALAQARAERSAEPDPSETERTSFLHIAEAMVINGGQTVATRTLWRVQIHDVSGWMLGSYGAPGSGGQLQPGQPRPPH
jgi:hypothetical protein